MAADFSKPYILPIALDRLERFFDDEIDTRAYWCMAHEARESEGEQPGNEDAMTDCDRTPFEFSYRGREDIPGVRVAESDGWILLKRLDPDYGQDGYSMIRREALEIRPVEPRKEQQLRDFFAVEEARWEAFEAPDDMTLRGLLAIVCPLFGIVGFYREDWEPDELLIGFDPIVQGDDLSYFFIDSCGVVAAEDDLVPLALIDRVDFVSPYMRRLVEVHRLRLDRGEYDDEKK